MPFQIYFGEIQVKNIKTGEVKTLSDIVFNDNTKPDNRNLKSQINTTIKKDGENWILHKLSKDKSKKVGLTID